MTYTYKAGYIGDSLWMVKRWTDNPEVYSEALIKVDTVDPQAAIDAAIVRDSWA